MDKYTVGWSPLFVFGQIVENPTAKPTCKLLVTEIVDLQRSYKMEFKINNHCKTNESLENIRGIRFFGTSSFSISRKHEDLSNSATDKISVCTDGNTLPINCIMTSIFYENYFFRFASLSIWSITEGSTR
jgi:hypothetical protein